MLGNFMLWLLNRMDKPKYLIEYTRVSSGKQLKGSGLETQKLSNEQVNELCENYGLTPYSEIFSDKAVSGFKVDASLRPSFSKLLTLIESGTISNDSVLVLSNIDRLSRQDINTALATLLRVMQHVHVFIVQENKLIKRDSPDLMVDLIMVLISMQRAYDESLSKATRSRSAIRHWFNNHKEGVRTKSGKPIPNPSGGVPFWYLTSKDELRLDTKLAEAAKKAVELFADGWGVVAVHSYLNEHYTPPKAHRGGKQWCVDALRRLHRDKALIGEYHVTVDGEKHVLTDYYEPIVSEQDYYRMVNQRNKSTRTAPSGAIHLFTGYGKSFCRGCGGSLTTTTSGGRTRIRCSNDLSKRNKCPNPVHVEGDKLLDVVNGLKLLHKFIPTEGCGNSEEVPKLEAKLTELNQQLDKMKADYMETQASILISLMVQKEAEIEAIKGKVDSQRASNMQSIAEWYYPSIKTEEKRRAYFERVLDCIKVHRLAKGKTIVSLYAKSGYCTNIYFLYGKVKKVGMITQELSTERELKNDNVFNQIAKSGVLTKWIKDQ